MAFPPFPFGNPNNDLAHQPQHNYKESFTVIKTISVLALFFVSHVQLVIKILHFVGKHMKAEHEEMTILAVEYLLI